MIWLLLILCLPLCFIFAGMESALLTLSKIRVRHASEEGDAKATRLNRLLEHRDDLLHVIAATNHLLSLLAFAGTALLIVRSTGIWGWAINLLVVIPLFVIVLEQLPKHLFSQKPFHSLRFFTGLLSLLRQLARPWLAISAKLKPRALELLPPEADNAGLDEFCKSIKNMQLLPPTCLHWMDQYTDMQKAPTLRYTTPLRKLTAHPPDMSLSRWLNANMHQQQPQSWHVVLAENGKLLGWFDSTTLPSSVPSDKLLSQYLRPLPHVNATDTAWQTLQLLRKRGDPIASVHDHHHQIIGIISQDTLLANFISNTTPITPLNSQSQSRQKATDSAASGLISQTSSASSGS